MVSYSSYLNRLDNFALVVYANLQKGLAMGKMEPLAFILSSLVITSSYWAIAYTNYPCTCFELDSFK